MAADVLDKAQNFSGGPIAAARQRERWLLKAANTSNEETAEQYREAAADLAARYPDIEDLEPGQAEGFARQRGHGSRSRSPVHNGRSRPRSSSPAKRSSTPAKPSPRTSSGGNRRAPAAATRRSSPAPTPRVDRAIRQTGIPAAASAGGSTVMMALGGTVGLGLLYLVLSSGERGSRGGAALPKVIGAVTGAVHRFLGLGDFFPSNQPKGRYSQHTTVQATHAGKTTALHFEGHKTIHAAAERLKAAEAAEKGHHR